MFKKITKAVIVLALVTIVVYLLHQFVFSIFNVNEAVFQYSLVQLYLFFGFFSLIVVIRR